MSDLQAGVGMHLEVCKDLHRVKGLDTLKGLHSQSLGSWRSRMDGRENKHVTRTQVLFPKFPSLTLLKESYLSPISV